MNSKNGYAGNISGTMIVHYVRLFVRSGIFIVALINYIKNRIMRTVDMFGGIFGNNLFFITVWGYFLFEVGSRFFPSSLESRGSQKQFAANYKKKEKYTPEEKIKPDSIRGVLIFWIALNGIIGSLYYADVIDGGILILISLLYAICDEICILFFCPFQTWFMKNRCCGTCRIYNWDYIMMFTPLIFIPNIFTYTLVLFAVALLVKWEYNLKKYPERFSEKSNAFLSCASCTEKLCRHKKQLRGFIAKGTFDISGNELFRTQAKTGIIKNEK